MRSTRVAIAILSILVAGCGDSAGPIAYDGPTAEWPEVGQSLGGQRFSELTQITRHNVDQLKVAWTHRSGDFSAGNNVHGPTAMQTTPLIVDGSLYYCTPYNRVFALDPESGEEHWQFDPKVNFEGVYTPSCRGVAYWKNPQVEPSTRCAARIFEGTLDARLIALDAKTGEPCGDFGEAGTVNLLDGLGDVAPGEYYMTSTPLVINDLVVTGAFVKDGQRLDAPSGAIRAFDAVSGELVWVWDPVPPGKAPVTAEQVKAGAVLTRGTPNAWTLLSGDPERGLVFVPTGNPSPDHYGGNERDQMDYYGTSFIALDAATGKIAWNYQAVHHDVWDYDNASQIVTFEQANGRAGVIAPTKLGNVFLLDRETGEPLFPVEEREVPQTDVPGEYTSATQPFPTKPAPLHPHDLKREDVWGVTFWDRNKCLERFDEMKYQGIFTPPGVGQDTLIYPGIGGGMNWGSASVNPARQRMIVNMQVAPFTAQLVARDDAASLGGDQVGYNPQDGTPYAVIRGLYMSPFQTPCVPPPWGKLFAIDLNSGEVIWERTLGNLNGLAPLGDWFEWGTPNAGGSIQTASDLVFIAATMDKYIRAFDGATGEELWRYELPFAGMATPVTYRLREDGKQYIVIAAGGHGPLGAEAGDVLMAFALPD